MRDRLHFFFLNVGHFLDHLLMLVFATVAALVLTREWGVSYAALVPYATPGFVAFGVCALPAGWLADRWSRQGMMAVFFVGIGIASMATALATTPFEMAFGLFVIGVFAAIYHPVGLALLVQKFARTGAAIGINGVFGNLGVGSAALITGYFIDHGGWRAGFLVPGAFSLLIGLAYTALFWNDIWAVNGEREEANGPARREGAGPTPSRDFIVRLLAIVFFTTAVSGIIFQSTTFALPKVFEERLTGIAGSATLIGWLAFIVFAVASLAQVVVGFLLDRFGPRPVFMAAAAIQAVFFAVMPGLTDWAALVVALAFMLGAFGQIPINDYMIGKLAKSELRASIYGARYVVTFAVLGATLPLISWVHDGWGFDMLFKILAVAAAVIFAAVALLPARLPEQGGAAPARA
ncbi:MAG TPA: MFS transporter [Hyphomicrobiaceae bacterium]|nr:MFS transporter [Hyphomicrobiaceae bacterium]